jgi:hypothetical protein
MLAECILAGLIHVRGIVGELPTGAELRVASSLIHQLESEFLARQQPDFLVEWFDLHDQAIEDVRHTLPEEWRESNGQWALGPDDVTALRSRLRLITEAAHAKSEGMCQLWMRPGGDAVMTGGRKVNRVVTGADGSLHTAEYEIGTRARIQLHRFSLGSQRLEVDVLLSCLDQSRGQITKGEKTRIKPIDVPAGQAVAVLMKSPVPDAAANVDAPMSEQGADKPHRLCLITPGRLWKQSIKGP